MMSGEDADADQPGEQAAALGAQREGRRRGRAGAGAAGRCRGRRAGPGRCRAARSIRAADEQEGERGQGAGRSSTAGRAPANGRSSSAQPSGVAHRSQPADEVSATIRSEQRDGEHAAPAIPVAMRRVGATWLATAPTPTKTGSGETSASERKTEGPAPARPARIPASSASHTIAAPSAIAGERRRETRGRGSPAPERTSSRRPASSSARSARTAASTPHSAGEDREGAQPPRHVAADGEQVVRHAVEQAHGAVVAEAALELQAVLERRVGGAVGRRPARRRPAGTAARTRSSACARRAAVWRASALAADTAVRAVVVVQEDLLERRLAAVERDHGMPGEGGDERPDAAGDLERAPRWRPRSSRLHARQRRAAAGAGPVEGDVDGLRAEVAQLGQRPLLDEPPAAQDADAVAERLDLAEDVRGEEDGLPALAWPRARSRGRRPP